MVIRNGSWVTRIVNTSAGISGPRRRHRSLRSTRAATGAPSVGSLSTRSWVTVMGTPSGRASVDPGRSGTRQGARPAPRGEPGQRLLVLLGDFLGSRLALVECLLDALPAGQHRSDVLT